MVIMVYVIRTYSMLKFVENRSVRYKKGPVNTSSKKQREVRLNPPWKEKENEAV